MERSMETVRMMLSAVAIVSFYLAGSAFGQSSKYNFPDRKAVILDTCPFIKLNEFSWNNFTETRTYSSKHEFKFAWTNTGQQPVVAFEIVTLKYDPFNQPLTGSRMVVTGRNSADFTPLKPGESQNDGFYGYGHSNVFTAIAYIRAARLGDGTIWIVDESQLRAALKRAAPTVRDYGPLTPERKSDQPPAKTGI